MAVEFKAHQTSTIPQDRCTPDLVRQIIERESIAAVFHPICSVRKRRVIGFEALSRGVDPGTGALIRPDLLFTVAKASGQAIALDRLCRAKALESFRRLQEISPEWTLFINFDTSIIDEGVVGSGVFREQVKSAGIPPSRVVIEVIESRVHEIGDLQSFVRAHKEEGFLVAIDDLGAGYSNLERISTLKPDIIKIDRSIVDDIESRYHKQEIFRSLVNLGHKLGAVVLAEGIETAPQCLQCLDLGADLSQGFYFHKPTTIGHLRLDEANERAAELATDFRTRMLQRTCDARILEERHRAVVNRWCASLAHSPLDRFGADLLERIQEDESVECAYLLDNRGTQRGRTVFRAGEKELSPRFIFYPAETGADHSMKDYFLHLQAGLRSYFTPPYISLATGARCRTLAHCFQHEALGQAILCVDFRPREFS